MTHRRRTSAVSALIAGLAALLAAAPAEAQFYGPAYAAPLYVVTPDRSLLSVDGQYFRPTPSGVIELCGAKPELCRPPEVVAQIQRLRRRQVTFWALSGSGGVAALTGAGLMIGGACTDARGAGSPLLVSGLIVLGAGALIELASLFVAPTQDDLRHAVNAINQAPGEPRVKWNLTLGPRGLPHLAASLRL